MNSDSGAGREGFGFSTFGTIPWREAFAAASCAREIESIAAARLSES